MGKLRCKEVDRQFSLASNPVTPRSDGQGAPTPPLLAWMTIPHDNFHEIDTRKCPGHAWFGYIYQLSYAEYSIGGVHMEE